MRPLSRKRRPLDSTRRRRTPPGLEALEARLAPAILLTYGGLGSVLGLQELVSGSTLGVTISEPVANQIRIDLGSKTFDGSSTPRASGLTYEIADSPSTSHHALLDISQMDGITNLQAALPGVSLTLGPITNASGGLANITASASVITVAGLDTSNATTGNGNVDLRASQSLTVAPDTSMDTGAGTLALRAGLNEDGSINALGNPVDVGDAGFEATNVGSGAGAYVYRPAGTAWTFIGDSGVSGNRSGFTGSGSDAPQADRVAFLQQQGSISQTIDLPLGLYTLSFLAAQRGGAAQASFQTVQVAIDGKALGGELRPSGTNYESLTTPSVRLAAGVHTITLRGVNPNGGDNTAFVDAIRLARTSPLEFSVGSTVTSSNATADAITLQGDSILIDTSPDGALIGTDGFVGGPPIARLGGVDQPRSVALDAQGTLYAVDTFNSVVHVFAAGSTAPTATLTGLPTPTVLALDAAGNLFVGDVGVNAVFKFAPGATTPTATLTGLAQPSALTLDAQSNLYVANTAGDSVSVFAPGATTPTGTLTGLEFPSALAFDSRGYLFVGNTGLLGAPVVVFAPGATSPTYELTSDAIVAPVVLAIDSSDNVYVASVENGSIGVFAPNATNPSRTINGANRPTAMAVDGRGNLYVIGDGGDRSVLVIAAGANSPSDRISGLTAPTALRYDPGRDQLYVGDESEVWIFGLRTTAGGVVIRAASPDRPISVGSSADPNVGMSLTTVELAQIYTAANGELTFGDPSQTGDITFSGLSPSIPGTGIAAIQSPTGPGAIKFGPATGGGPSLSTGAGSIRLSAGAGGILNVTGPLASNIAASGSVTLDTTGGIGGAGNPLTFDAAAPPSSVTIGATNAPASAVLLGALGTLALADVRTANAPLVVVADGDLTVMSGAIVDTGTGTLSLTAGIDPFGVGSGAGTLTIGAGAGVVSRSTGSAAISLRAYALEIVGGEIPATVGLARGVGIPPVPVAGGVVLRSSDPTRAILVGGGSGSGLVLSKGLLAQIFTTATGTLTFGDSTQDGDITFSSVTPATTPGADVVAVQSALGGGAILLDNTAGTALVAGTGGIQLAAGAGGIRTVGSGTSLATTGPVTFDSMGGIGSTTARLLFDAETPSLVTVGGRSMPASGVFLGAPGSLSLGHVATNNAVLDVITTGDLTVTTGAVVDTGTASLSLAAGVNLDGSPGNGSGTITLLGGAQVSSASPGTNAITLRGSDIAIDTTDTPVLVGARPGTGGSPPTPVAGGVQIRASHPDSPISLGATSAATGLVLSSDELSRIFTTAGGTLTFGDSGQTGSITFAAVAPAASSNVVAIQSPTGTGVIILDSTAGTALDAGERPIRLAAGTGGIVAQGGGASLSTTVPITLDTAAGIGTSSARVVLDGAATFALLTIGGTTVPGGGVYLGGLGGVTLGDIRTADAPLDVNGAMFVAVSPAATIDTGSGTLSLAAGVNPDGSPASGPGVIGVENGATVVSRNTGPDAITLRGADIEIATGAGGAYVGALPSPFSTNPSATITGLASPQGLVLDAQGNLYVADTTNNTVSVFAPGSTTPFRTLTGLNGPANMAFDASGNLYVTNNGGNTVSAFSPGTTTPSWTLTGLSTPYSIAVDAQGFLYVGNFETSTVSLFLPRNTTPFKTINVSPIPTAMTFDGFGNLYVPSPSTNTVSVFGPGGGALIRTLTGLDEPTDLTFDARGNLYVLNSGQRNTVSVFAPESTTPTTTITGLSGPFALALDAVGNLYVANASQSGAAAGTVSVIPQGSTTPTVTLLGLDGPKALLLDSLGRLVATNSGNGTVNFYSTPRPTPLAGGVAIETSQSALPISMGASSGDGLSLSDAELAQIFAVPGGGLTVGDASQTGDITLVGPVARHPGYDTLILRTPQGAINAVGGATLAVANLALLAGSGIGTTGAVTIDATHLAFATQSGPIRLGDTNAVALTSVGTLATSSIPGDIFSAANVGESYTLLRSGGGVSGQITYDGRALAEGATLTLADGKHYRISYKGNGGQDVTLTRIASLTSPPPPSPRPVLPAASVSLVGTTLVIIGSETSDVIKLIPNGRTLRVYASFLPAGVDFLSFRRAAVRRVHMQLGEGDDFASVHPRLLLPVVMEGGAGDDGLMAGGGRSLLIGGSGRDVLAAGQARGHGSILIGGVTTFDTKGQELSALLGEWSSSRSRRTRIANLTQGNGSRRRHNGGAYLTPDVLVDDLARDILLGNTRRDWLLPGTDDEAPGRNPQTVRGALLGRRA